MVEKINIENIKTQNNQYGFTILEVLIAMAIFAIGILGVASMQMSAVTGNGKVRKYSEASAFAQNQIELLMSTSFNSLPASPATPVPINGYTVNVLYSLDIDNNGAPDINLDLDLDGDDDLMRVEVFVQDPSGVERSRLSFVAALDD